MKTPTKEKKHPPIAEANSPPLEGLGVVHTSLSQEANAVLAEGKELWQAYFTYTDIQTLWDELKLNQTDVGWYQVRKALQQAGNASGDNARVAFNPFEEAYKAITEKLQPMMYELGF